MILAGMKILSNYLNSLLDLKLKRWSANNFRKPKLVLVGIGNEFFGDDAAGIYVVRDLKRRFSNSESIFLVEASVAPENFTGPIRKFSPDWVWIIDAADMNLNSGEVEILNLDQIDGISAFSHRMPLTLFARYIYETTNAEISFFGIQPEETGAYLDVTKTIKKTCQDLGEMLAEWIKTNIQ
jgi:hydrogenase 3 maturation protease